MLIIKETKLFTKISARWNADALHLNFVDDVRTARYDATARERGTVVAKGEACGHEDTPPPAGAHRRDGSLETLCQRPSQRTSCEEEGDEFATVVIDERPLRIRP